MIADALVELISVLNSPQRDDLLLREAGVSVDRALFPLLVRLGASGAMSVADLGEHSGRDHTTISRQLAKLESLGLISRPKALGDRRVRAAALTSDGEAMVQAITDARRRLLTHALAAWTETDRGAFAALSQRFAAALKGPA